MYLKSIAIKGFKSFANKTELEFQPGISMVVGPNGSGKSNITDAIQWVLGEQSPSSLRGSAMQDVIFAGSLNHKPLGLAEVTLTLDNTDKSLDLEFSEITVTRRISRSGENLYSINSTPCRLLDIYELLHDSGLGRQTHSIIGQGKLEEVINSKPEDKRVLLEEAAGVLKHKKRKERALRKLVSTEDNLKRAKDILREINQQLKPLEEQVSKAKSFNDLTNQLKELEIALIVKKISNLKKKAEGIELSEQKLQKELSDVDTQASRISNLISQEEEKYQNHADEIASQQMLKERLASISAALENIITLQKHKDLTSKKNIEETKEQFSTTENQLNLKIAQIKNLRKQIEDTQTEIKRNLKSIALKRKESEHLSPGFESISDELAKENQKLADVNGKIKIKEKESLEKANSIYFNQKEQEKQKQQLANTQNDILNLKQESEKLKDLKNKKKEILEKIDTHLVDATDKITKLKDRMEQKESEISDLIKKKSQIDGQLSFLRNLHTELEPKNILRLSKEKAIPSSSVAKALKVKKEYVKAVDSYLEYLIKGVAVNNFEDAKKILSIVKEKNQSISIVIKGEKLTEPTMDVDIFSKKTPPWLKVLFRNVNIVNNLDSVGNKENVTYLTLDGEIISEGIIRADYRKSNKGLLGVSDELAENESNLRKITELLAALNNERENLVGELTNLNEKLEKCKSEADSHKSDIINSEGKISFNEQLINQKGKAIEELENSINSSQDNVTKLKEVKIRLNADLEALTRNKFSFEKNIEVLKERHQKGLEHKQSSRIASTELNYQAKHLNHQLLGLNSQLKENLNEQEKLEKQLKIYLNKLKQADRSILLNSRLLPLIDVLANVSERIKTNLKEQQQSAGSFELLKKLRQDEKEIIERQKNIEIKKQQFATETSNLKNNLDNLVDIVVSEHNLAVETAIQNYNHIEANQNLLSSVKQQLKEIGPVNAVAEEQFSDLNKRRTFLEKQIEDLLRSRDGINKIIRAIDSKIKESLLYAFQEISQTFKQLFCRLFPGGQAELVLTGDNIFESGLDIHAQPYGKSLKKLSLLSGGETALTALALLFAVYHTRPSPFYVLDEVEAALDDINLQRFIRLLKEMKTKTQFLVITHQRRTMEVADCLYGITMQADGVTKVVSQKLEANQEKHITSETASVS